MYLQSGVPTPGQKSVKTKYTWHGLDYNGILDSAYLSECENCEVSDELSYVGSTGKLTAFSAWNSSGKTVLSIHGFSDFLIVVYVAVVENVEVIKLDYVKWNETRTSTDIYTATLANSTDLTTPRTIIRAVKWTGNLNIAETVVYPKLLVYPDMYSFDYEQTSNETFIPEYFGTTIPHFFDASMNYARVFGIIDDRILASKSTNYADYTLDSADSITDTNAWASVLTGNSSGKVKAVTTFDGHVLVFKSDKLHEIYNNKNPFRISDISNIGTLDKRSVWEVGNKLFFVSRNGIYAYYGGTPVKMSSALNKDVYTYGVCGAYDGKYYVYDHKGDDHFMYIYNTQNGEYGKISINNELKGFAANDVGQFFLVGNSIYSGITYDNAEWSFETCIYTDKTVNPKRIKEIDFICDMGLYSSITVSLVRKEGTYGTITDEDELYTTDKSGLISVKLNVRGYQLSAYKLKFSGEGDVKVHNLEVVYG